MTDNVCGIYLITNKINGHMYVGQSIGIHRRWREHCALKDLHSSLVEKAIAKYGEENFSFEIIITMENDTEQLNDAEREWIAILNTYEDKNHYNLTPGGDFSPMKVPEIAAKMYGKKHSEQTRKKMSKAHRGREFSEEHRRKLAEKRIGVSLSDEVKHKISNKMNTTGFFRVYKEKNPRFKQGFRFCYQYYDENNKRRSICSVDLEKLEQKVKNKGLEWFKLEE